MPPRIHLKRAYLPPEQEDGARILVERLWPRGLRKTEAGIDAWFKELAPSPDLRRWYAHRPERWTQFRRLYRSELQAADPTRLAELVELCKTRPVTFVYAARDEARNGAVVLREFLQDQRTSPPLTSTTSPLT